MAECAALERRYTARYRGFESLPLRKQRHRREAPRILACERGRDEKQGARTHIFNERSEYKNSVVVNPSLSANKDTGAKRRGYWIAGEIETFARTFFEKQSRSD